MKKFLTAVAACLSLLSAEASANVVYHWETLTTSSTIAAFSAEFVITNKAFANGSLYFKPSWGCNYNNDPFEPRPTCRADPTNPFVSFSAFIDEANQPPDPWGGSTISVNQHTGMGWLYPVPPFIDVTFHAREIFSGSFNINDGESAVSMTGSNGIWTITNYSSDAGTCFFHCSGATGRFVRVPEPNTLALFLPAVAAFALARRRRSGGVSTPPKSLPTGER